MGLHIGPVVASLHAIVRHPAEYEVVTGQHPEAALAEYAGDFGRPFIDVMVATFC